jgi:hypothetical protein
MENEIRTYQDQLEWSNKQLRAENERLRDALKEIADDCKRLFRCDVSNKLKVYDIAKQALNEVTK